MHTLSYFGLGVSVGVVLVVVTLLIVQWAVGWPQRGEPVYVKKAYGGALRTGRLTQNGSRLVVYIEHSGESFEVTSDGKFPDTNDYTLWFPR